MLFFDHCRPNTQMMAELTMIQIVSLCPSTYQFTPMTNLTSSTSSNKLLKSNELMTSAGMTLEHNHSSLVHGVSSMMPMR